MTFEHLSAIPPAQGASVQDIWREVQRSALKPAGAAGAPGGGWRSASVTAPSSTSIAAAWNEKPLVCSSIESGSPRQMQRVKVVARGSFSLTILQGWRAIRSVLTWGSVGVAASDT